MVVPGPMQLAFGPVLTVPLSKGVLLQPISTTRPSRGCRRFSTRRGRARRGRQRDRVALDQSRWTVARLPRRPRCTRQIVERFHERAAYSARAERPAAVDAPGRTTWCTGPLCGRWRSRPALPQAAGCLANGPTRPRRPSQPGPGTSARGRSAEIRAQRDRHRRPAAGEDVALVADIARLSELDTLREAATTARATLCGTPDADAFDRGAVDSLGRARAALQSSDDAALRGWPNRSVRR